MKSFVEIDHSWHVVWVDITVWGETVFLDIPVSTSTTDARKFIEEIMRDDALCVNERWFIETSKGTVLQVGKILDWEMPHTSAHARISWEIKPNSRMVALKDDGTIWKSKWRFSLLQYAKKIFPEWINSDKRVIFMPGMWRDEFNLWKSLWVHSSDMILIEWDENKIAELSRKYRNNGSTPWYVNSYFWTWDETFSKELIEEIDEKAVSVLSLDTESWLSLWLYKDLLWVISNMNIEDEFLFMLNIVRRWSTTFSKQFTTWDDQDDAIDKAMKKLPSQMLIDSDRDEFWAYDIQTWTYLWGSSTPMHFVFAHIKKK